jgi:hypothetical protein
MGREETRLTNTLTVTNDQDMTRLCDTFYVTNDQGCDKANWYFICHKYPRIWLGQPMLYLSQMGRDMTSLTNTVYVTNDQGYD